MAPRWSSQRRLWSREEETAAIGFFFLCAMRANECRSAKKPLERSWVSLSLSPTLRTPRCRAAPRSRRAPTSNSPDQNQGAPPTQKRRRTAAPEAQPPRPPPQGHACCLRARAGASKTRRRPLHRPPRDRQPRHKPSRRAGPRAQRRPGRQSSTARGGGARPAKEWLAEARDSQGTRSSHASLRGSRPTVLLLPPSTMMPHARMAAA